MIAGRPGQLALILLLAGFALGQQGYRVDQTGGPLTFGEEVTEAAAAWNEVAAEVLLENRPDAANSILFGEVDRLGPDTVSVTLLRDESLQARVHPQLYREYPSVLLHELGLLLGLPASSEGVMRPLLDEGGPPSPTEADLTALQAAGRRLPGDIDGDGEVGLSDLAELGRAYGRRGVNLAADLDQDGVVGAGDIEILRGAYRFTDPSAAEHESGPAGGESEPAAVEEDGAEPGSEQGNATETNQPEPADERTGGGDEGGRTGDEEDGADE